MTGLDTNVISEVLKPSPAVEVLDWLSAQAPSSVYITTITVAEILHGVESLPSGKRRARLSAVVNEIFTDDFRDRVLPFDEYSARLFANIVVGRRSAGRPISQFDAMIAAIPRSHRAAVATRNIVDFDVCGIPVVNPWRL